MEKGVIFYEILNLLVKGFFLKFLGKFSGFFLIFRTFLQINFNF